MDTTTLLLERRSHGKVSGPEPTREQLELMYRAALRAPDHKSLAPFRFVELKGKGRERLGELCVHAEKSRKPESSEEHLQSIRDKCLRAPVIIAVIAKVQDNPKVPRVEQVVTAGCAAQAMLYAAYAEGLGAMWRTGDFAYHPAVREAFGLTPMDELVGFLYIGQKVGEDKTVHSLDPADFVDHWDA